MVRWFVFRDKKRYSYCTVPNGFGNLCSGISRETEEHVLGAFVYWTALREAAGYGDALTDEHLIQWRLKSGYHAAFARVHQNWEMDWLCIICRDFKVQMCPPE